MIATINSEILRAPSAAEGHHREPVTTGTAPLIAARIIPVRCCTCSKIASSKREACLGLRQAEDTEALDALRLKRYCCRRRLLGHVDPIEKLLNYAPLRT
ncbi:DNA-directed RNA polymerases I, II, and III subunit RPABC5 [Dasypus novemcinctus]|uniref:DNA-directed RNA polymerases I, II, and III subunit RPABC5 n=1 Tax=Dasypus novemcinctus TaxID=9361 RepID=UPI0003291376